MRSFRTWLVLITLFIVGMGFYRGWFVLSNSPENSVDNKVNIHLTVDPDKAKADADKVKETVRDGANDLSDQLTE